MRIMEWISVKKEEPKIAEGLMRCSENIMCYTKNRRMFVGFYQVEKKEFYNYETMEPEEYEVTHWMPLPEPPSS